MMIPDFRVQVKDKNNFRILQLTDMQVIDAEQRRYPERLRDDEVERWHTWLVGKNCYDPIRTSVAKTNPDLIIITGDLVYASFDDAGTAFDGFLDFMDSFGIPWAPVFGNHDNETAKGIDWQCERLTRAKNCLFARGNVTGNSNYTVGLYDGDMLLRVLYMMDSNACYGGEDPHIARRTGPAEDQRAWLTDTAEKLAEQAGAPVPGFVCMHIPPADMMDAIVAAGYQDEERVQSRDQQGGISLGEAVPGCDHILPVHTEGDCGGKVEWLPGQHCSPRMEAELLAAHADGVFAGHFHKINLSVAYHGIRYTCGVKCGYYDYHEDGMLGCTEITLTDSLKSFRIRPIYHD